MSNELENINKKAELSAYTTAIEIECIPRKDTVVSFKDRESKTTMLDYHAKNCAHQIITICKNNGEQIVEEYVAFLKNNPSVTSIFYKDVKLIGSQAVEREAALARQNPITVYLRHFGALHQYVVKFVADKTSLMSNKKLFSETVMLYLEEFKYE